MSRAARPNRWSIPVQALLLAAAWTAVAAAQQYQPYGDYPTTAVTPGYPTPSAATYRPDPNQPIYYTRPGENRQQRAPWQAPALPSDLPPVQQIAPGPNYAAGGPAPYVPNRPGYPSTPAAASPESMAPRPQPTVYGTTPFAPPPLSSNPPTTNLAPFASAPPASASLGGDPRGPQSLRAALSVFEPAQRIAQVGDQPILAGDVMGLINQTLELNKDKVAELPPDELERQKELATRQLLRQLIETKILYVGFLREVRSKAGEDKFAELYDKIRQDALKSYDEEKLEEDLKAAGVTTPADLDIKLRQFGTSLQKRKESYVESELGRAGVMQNINRNPEITYDEILAYYQQHIDEYHLPAKARWEQITVRFDNFPDKRAAWEFALARWNEIVYGGAPFAAVARRHSQDFAAENGGLHDWTTKGSLSSERLDQAIFSYDLHKVSEIIEDERGMHIVRVLERQDEGNVPFLVAQEEIKAKLLSEKRNKQVAEYISQLRKSVPVWTIFDDPADETRAVERPPLPRSTTR